MIFSGRTLAFADYERSEVGGKTIILENIVPIKARIEIRVTWLASVPLFTPLVFKFIFF
jgi:hypothetical protein